MTPCSESSSCFYCSPPQLQKGRFFFALSLWTNGLSRRQRPFRLVRFFPSSRFSAGMQFFFTSLKLVWFRPSWREKAFSPPQWLLKKKEKREWKKVRCQISALRAGVNWSAVELSVCLSVYCNERWCAPNLAEKFIIDVCTYERKSDI